MRDEPGRDAAPLPHELRPVHSGVQGPQGGVPRLGCLGRVQREWACRTSKLPRGPPSFLSGHGPCTPPPPCTLCERSSIERVRAQTPSS